MTGVLDGVRVLEVAEWGFVPSAGTVLGDWGAEVIKVEHPRFGDPIRGLITGGLIPGASGRNFIVEQLGRNKRSLGLDLTKPAGRELLDRLVVARMPEVSTEVGPNGLEQPLGHQVGMDVDDRIRRLDRGAHPYTGVSQWRYRGSSPRTALK